MEGEKRGRRGTGNKGEGRQGKGRASREDREEVWGTEGRAGGGMHQIGIKLNKVHQVGVCDSRRSW